jgi:triphosphatase
MTVGYEICDVSMTASCLSDSRFGHSHPDLLKHGGLGIKPAWNDTEFSLSRLGKSARSLAVEAIERLYQRARKKGNDLVGLEPGQRHRVRIILKNLRYTLDFFGSCFDDRRAVRKFSKPLGVLQDSLGANNDAVAALKIVSDLEQSITQSGSRAAGIVLGWCGHEAGHPDVSLRDKWRAFRKAGCFWR